MLDQHDAGVDAATFRRTLGQFCTGVVVVTGSFDGRPVGLAVNAFSSVSLDPPLVGFFPAKSSSSWPAIRANGSFCANVLAASQLDVCRRFATSGVDKFSGVSWNAAPSGSPRLDSALAWIDCAIHAVHDAGDHWCVLGRVGAIGVGEDVDPLVFLSGKYGRFHAFERADPTGSGGAA